MEAWLIHRKGHSTTQPNDSPPSRAESQTDTPSVSEEKPRCIGLAYDWDRAIVVTRSAQICAGRVAENIGLHLDRSARGDFNRAKARETYTVVFIGVPGPDKWTFQRSYRATVQQA